MVWPRAEMLIVDSITRPRGMIAEADELIRSRSEVLTVDLMTRFEEMTVEADQLAVDLMIQLRAVHPSATWFNVVLR